MDKGMKMKVNKGIVREFATALLQGLGDDKTKWFKEHGIPLYEGNVRFSHEFPRWSTISIGYFTAKLLERAKNVIEFEQGQAIPASYNTIEYQREKKITTLKEGYAALDVEGKPIIISVTPYSWSWEFNLWCRKRDKEMGQKIFNKFKNDVDNAPFLKGEKLLITHKNKIQFIKYPKKTRKDLILDKKIWETLDKNLFFVIKNREDIVSRGLNWRRGVLIWGLPGTGKTLFGRVLCNEITDVTMLWITPRCIEDENDVSKIFEMGRTLAPTILFFEDLDFFAPDRDEGGPSWILGELLTQLDGLSPNEGIFVIGTTNKPNILDTAIKFRPARFDVKIKFDLPTQKQREEMYRLFLNDREDIDYGRLARMSDKMTGAYVRESCIRGILATLKDGKTDLEGAVLCGINSLREEEMRTRAPGAQVA